jgi:hypothetical protein
MGIFLDLMSCGSSQPKLKKYRDMKDYTSNQMRDWLMKNMTLDQIIELCGLLILEELNNETTPITITQEEFEQHFRIRKPQANPHRSKSEYNQAVRENQ